MALSKKSLESRAEVDDNGYMEATTAPRTTATGHDCYCPEGKTCCWKPGRCPKPQTCWCQSWECAECAERHVADIQRYGCR